MISNKILVCKMFSVTIFLANNSLKIIFIGIFKFYRHFSAEKLINDPEFVQCSIVLIIIINSFISKEKPIFIDKYYQIQ